MPFFVEILKMNGKKRQGVYLKIIKITKQTLNTNLGITAENAYATDFQVTKTRASRLNIRWGVGGDDNADDWQVSIMDQQGRHYTVNSKNPSWANREIRGTV